ncbi:MAG: pyruvate kinase, partial [Spirochaetales bacterium]|nr:pyruvate kinase [Spirochaetales bacterium]
ELALVAKGDGFLECEVVDGLVINPRKSVNVPKCKLNIPPLSDKDVDFIRFAAENDIEFIAHSFVRHEMDAMRVQAILDEYNSKVKIIAKIENQEGVDNIDKILNHVYGIMVARGDLGIEIEAPKIPSIQKLLMRTARAKRKPVIVATQMLHSMISNPRPTRAEVSDIANAIYDGTDAIMLSGETAYGKYPVEAVRVMAETARNVESCSFADFNICDYVLTNPVSSFLAKSAIRACSDMPISAIVADSFSGRTIRALSAYRPRQPIFAMCYDARTMRELSLSYGVVAEYMPTRDTTDEFLFEALVRLQNRTKISPEDLVLVLAGNFGTSNGASFIEISKVDRLLEQQAHYLKEKNEKKKLSNS